MVETTITSLRSFLHFLKNEHIWKSTPSSVLKVVCGNEAADFDSVASALTYAFCSYQKDPQNPLMPIINIPRIEFPLRKDVVRALERLKITEDLLFFNDDFRYYQNLCGSVNAVLVDHNEIDTVSKPLINKVVGIIDHHKDQKLHLQADPRIVLTSGSCSSLVFNYWKDVIFQCGHELSKETAILCMGAALLDTSNFRYKVVEQDLEALKFYETILPNFDRTEYYKQLKSDKDDLEGMHIKDIFKKDYKEFTFEQGPQKIRIGISSVSKSLHWLEERCGNSDEFNAQCFEAQNVCNVDVFVVMTAWEDGEEFKRELIILSHDGQLGQQIVKKISPELKLENFEQTNTNERDDDFYLNTFKQLNVLASRKRVAPLLDDAFQSISIGK